MFERAVIETGAGKSFEVIAHNYSPTNKYIQSAKLNGKDWNQSWFEHKELMNGAKITMKMSSTPNKQRGVRESDFPYSFSKEVR